MQSLVQQDIIDLFGEEHTSAAGTIKMFGEDQLKQNILSKIPRIQQHIINEDFDYNYMAKRLQCRESSGQHPKIAWHLFQSQETSGALHREMYRKNYLTYKYRVWE